MTSSRRSRLKLLDCLPEQLQEWSPGGLLAAGIFLLFLHVLFVWAAIVDFAKCIFLLVILCAFWIYVAVCAIEPLLPDSKHPWIVYANEEVTKRPYLGTLVAFVPLLAILIYVLVQAIGDGAKLSSLGTILLILVISILCSDHPGRIKWRPVVWGLLLQYVLAFLILKWPTGQNAVQFTVEKIVAFLSYTSNGTSFVYGFIAAPPTICGLEAPFTYSALQTFIFFSSIFTLAYYLGIVQWVLRRVSVIFQYTMGTTAAESLNVMGSCLMGPTEAAVMLKYALTSMTTSEIVSSVAMSFSTLSGSLFAIYISFGACPSLLLAANVMSGPATVVVSKIISPEIQRSRQHNMKTFKFPEPEEETALQAISSGAISAGYIVTAIVVNLIVFLALIALLDRTLSYLAELVGFDGITFDVLLGYAFFPVALFMGSSAAPDWETRKAETLKIAQLIGSKTVLNEFIAYQEMQQMLLRGEISARAQVIAVFALCGYSNAGQIGGVLAQFAAMCPERRAAFAKASTKGLLIGSLACFMTACVAGSIADDSMGCMPDNPAANCVDISDVMQYFLPGPKTTSNFPVR